MLRGSLTRGLVALCAGLILAAGGCATPSGHADMTGSYDLAGETADGGGYRGALVVKDFGVNQNLAWQRDRPLDRAGFALQLGNVLGVALTPTPDIYAGIVLYRVQKGHLEGIWEGKGDEPADQVGHETLDGPEGLEGHFTIARGQNPGPRISEYYGTVEIRKAGSVYAVDWSTPSPSYIGTGVLLGDVFVVAYAEKRRPGVAAYCLTDPGFVEGVMAEAGAERLGAEVLWRTGGKAPDDLGARLSRLRTGNAACGTPISLLPPPPAQDGGAQLAALR
jgi:hypothetical protein